MLKKLFYLYISFLIFACFISTPELTAATTPTCTVSGMVTEISGNPISGAAVSLKCTVLKFNDSRTTGTDGKYEFSNLYPAGKYVMTANKQGYRRARIVFGLIDGENKAIDIKLKKKTQNTNEAPVVNAGPDQTITLPDSAILNGIVSDDGLPDGSMLTTNWSKVSGPGTVTFDDPSQPVATASFSEAGDYELQLTASDSKLSGSDRVTITVNQAIQKPTVSINANPGGITMGETATLNWNSTHANSAEIDQGIGAVAVNGSQEVSPTQTTTYTITVTGDGGTFTASATVVVNYPAPTVTISANPGAITMGEKCTLNWSSTNASSAEIDQGIGAVAVNGSLEVSPTQTTTYTITVTGNGGTATASATVVVNYPAPTVTISANPSAITMGEKCTLNWSSTNASSAEIDQGIGAVAVNGSLEVTPTQTTTYTITITGNGGTASASATVVVNYPAPTVTISANPGTITQGETATLSWSSTNATSAEIDQGIGTVAVNGSLEVTPTQTTTYTITVTGDGGTATASATVVVNYPAPTVAISANPGSITLGETATLSWSSTNATSAEIDQGIGTVAVNGSLEVTPTQTTTYTITVTGDGGTATASTTVVVNYPAPTVTISANPGTITQGGTATLTWSSTNATSAEIDQGIGAVALNGSLEVSPALTTMYTITATGDGGIVMAFITITVNPAIPLPPDPSDVAPPLDTTIATSMGSATAFLYTGDNPIQTGVAADTIQAYRCAVLRGTVLNRENQPLSGVAINILDHPEFGQTLSRADGMFDMAVNGGRLLTVNYKKDGYLSAQRQVDAPWEDYAGLPDVVMLHADTNVTTIDLASGNPMQVAQGNTVTDDDGVRTATVLFPQGTSAEMVLPDGTTQPLTTLNVRATEYTVGENGPKAMPAPLPPQSGYTYCVELSVDEAEAAGATNVQFSQPVCFYVENFLNFPVGTPVPVGYYDRKKGVWIPSDNGIIIRILSITGGMADVDTDGDGTADNTGLDNAEREKLAALYQPNQSLWRVCITHFSPWDCNWPYGPPASATQPKMEQPTIPDKGEPDTGCGSIIGIQKQTLGEAVGITGTPFSLHYESDRVPGRLADYSLNIPLSGTSTPEGLRRIELEVYVAGRQFTESFAPAPNLTHTFIWDGKDAYERVMQGRQSVAVCIGYTYQAVYQEPANAARSFAAFSGSGVAITSNMTRQEVTLWQKWKGIIGPWDNNSQGLGGGTMNIHHAYDPSDRTLYLGDGTSHNPQYTFGAIITTVVGNGASGYSGDGGLATQARLWRPRDIAVGGDGSIYIADNNNSRIRKVGPDGIITTVAGNGIVGYSGDGGLATQASLKGLSGVEVGNDGSLYIADTGNGRIRHVGPDGIITTVAGNGTGIYSGDGGLATQASLSYPEDVALGGDGSLYISDTSNNRIRRVGPDGIITTVAGNGTGIYSGDGGLATQAILTIPRKLAVGNDGSLYIADSNKHRIRRVDPNGIITTIAGNGASGYSGDGGLATQARLSVPDGVEVGNDGSLYIADTNNNRIRRIGPDGVITTVAGIGAWGYSGDWWLATQATFVLPSNVAVDKEGSLYIADTWNNCIRKIPSSSSQLKLFSEAAIASEDGKEFYVFDHSGRHLRTLNALTNAVIYEFTYNSNGYLTSIRDGDGNVTTIERDGDDKPTAIVAPFGQRTTLELNADGYITKITNPAEESIQLGYTNDGLLTSLTDARGNIKTYTYDAMGRLIKDADSVGGFTALGRTDTGNDYEVTKTTAEGIVSTYKVEHLSTGEERRTNSLCCGNPIVTMTGTDGTTKTTYPDGTIVSTIEGPDPRFSMQSPVLQSGMVTTPMGLVQKTTGTRTVTLSNPNDPLSLLTQTDTHTINGRIYKDVYNSTARTITSTSPVGRVSTSTINDQGRVIKTEISGLEPVGFEYDARGRLITTNTGTGTAVRTTTFSYNSEGYLDTLSNPLTQDTRFQYDQAGRTTRQILADLREIGFGYDPNGNTTSITPPGKSDHTFSFTKVNQEDTYNPPALGIVTTPTQYEYNLDKQLFRTIRPDGKTIQFAYNSKGKLELVTLPDNKTIAYTYDDTKGQLTTVTAPGGETLSYSYDGSLLLNTTWAGTINGSVSRTYNNNFWITSNSVNGGSTINYQYDNDGLLTGAGNLTISRNAQNGMITGTTLGSVSDILGYNTFGEVIDYRATYSASEIFATQFARDKLGRITEKTETVDGATHVYNYEYDLTGRLVRVKKDGALVSEYTYDSNGNRLSHNTASGTYDAQDRLITYGNNTYTYTTHGELLTKTDTSTSETTTYTYDVLGNLVSVALPDGTQIEYLIDGKNRRIGKKVDGTLVQGFLYQGGLSPIAELDNNGAIISRFVYANHINVPEYMIRGGMTYRIITDHLGSPRLVVDASTGQVVQRMDYDEFGNVTNDTNPGLHPFGFAGGIYDNDTKLVHFGARDYDAETGRWTAKDPILFDGDQLNLYNYVRNNPVNLVDPLGLVLTVPAIFDVDKILKFHEELFRIGKLAFHHGLDNLERGVHIGIKVVGKAKAFAHIYGDKLQWFYKGESYYLKYANVAKVGGKIFGGVISSMAWDYIFPKSLNDVDDEAEMAKYEAEYRKAKSENAISVNGPCP